MTIATPALFSITPRRSRDLHVLVTEAEHDVLRRLAETNGLNLSGQVRVLLAAGVRALDAETDREAAA